MNAGCAGIKLWDPLRTRAIPECLRGVFTTRRYTNPRLPYLTFTFSILLYFCIRIFIKRCVYYHTWLECSQQLFGVGWNWIAYGSITSEVTVRPRPMLEHKWVCSSERRAVALRMFYRDYVYPLSAYEVLSAVIGYYDCLMLQLWYSLLSSSTEVLSVQVCTRSCNRVSTAAIS